MKASFSSLVALAHFELFNALICFFKVAMRA